MLYKSENKPQTPNAELILYESFQKDFYIGLIDVSYALDVSEENTNIASLVLLYSLLCSKLLISFTFSNQPHALLENFVMFHHLLYYSFNGEISIMNESVGANTELIILSLEKSSKITEQKIIDSVLKYEEGYDEAETARNQVREVVGEIFKERAGVAMPYTSELSDSKFILGDLLLEGEMLKR